MNDIGQVQAALESYWKGNPQAVDTAEGISRWWTPFAPPHLVQTALDRLIGKGLVETVATRNGRVLYRWRKPPN